jgi:hydrogenase maturation protease
MNGTVVIGMGNPLLSDEGIGVYLLEQLKNRYDCDGFELRDLGTSGMSVLHAMAHKKKAVIIDCAFMGEEPGTIRRFNKDEVRSLKLVHGLSLHEGDLLSTLVLSESLGECPPHVVLFGIEPARLVLGEGLSDALLSQVERYLLLLARELELKERVTHLDG